MEIKKKFTFSGVFQKIHEADTQPLEISNATIFCYTNGNVFLEIDYELNQFINHKKFLESAPIYQYKGVTTEQLDALPFLPLNQFEEEMIQKPYEGDYEVKGTTIEGWKINAIIGDANFKIEFNNSKNIEEQKGKYQIRLIDLCIYYDSQTLGEGQIQEIVYGLANIEVIYNFSAKIGNLDAEIYIEPISNRVCRNKNDVLSAEMKFRNIGENQQDSYDTYYAWVASLLSLASGRCVDQIYRIRTIRYTHLQIKSEYWSGRKLRSEARGIAVIQSPDLHTFIQQCAKKLTSEIFNDKGLGLALSWYIDTFTSTIAEVNFLLLCTVLESLNKRYGNNTSNRLISKRFYKQIREKILKLVSDFKQEIDNKDDLEKYSIFALKVEKSFASGSYNQIGDLRTSLKEMLNTYGVPYNDLFPELEFIKIRDKIVHEGLGGVDVALELRKLSNLVVRVFLAILEYQGDYMESRKIEIDDKLGRSKHGLMCRRFPFICPKDNTVQIPDR